MLSFSVVFHRIRPVKVTLAADVSNSFLIFPHSLSHLIEARRLPMFLIFLADTGSGVHPQREVWDDLFRNCLILQRFPPDVLLTNPSLISPPVSFSTVNIWRESLYFQSNLENPHVPSCMKWSDALRGRAAHCHNGCWFDF